MRFIRFASLATYPLGGPQAGDENRNIGSRAGDQAYSRFLFFSWVVTGALSTGFQP